MIDYDVLKSVGTTNERLREILTAAPFPPDAKPTEEEKERREKDIKIRKEFEIEIQDRLNEHINFSLKNYKVYMAVDMAMEPPPIADKVVPLLLYAQGKLDLGACARELSNLTCANEFVAKNDKGEIVGIDLPKFWEMNVNLVRSVIRRRLAAQSNKYNNLFPYYKYEARSTGMVGKLRADIMSQVSDIIADQYDYRHHDNQVFRDTLCYSHSFDFVRTAWEREVQWVRDREVDEALIEEGEVPKKVVTVKEGVGFVNPHPTRVFWDNAYPASSINADIGCEYCGFWDVVRYKDVARNPEYFNRENVTYSSNVVTLFSAYSLYFSNYYTQIKAPPTIDDMGSANDRKNNLGIYTGRMDDTSMIIANYYRKLIPAHYGIGDYPYPVWVRFVVAGDNTVIFAEILPSTPAARCGFDENDSRQINLSMAHELIGYQDHITNLLSYLLLMLKSDSTKVFVVDIDTMTAEQVNSIRERLKGENYYSRPIVIEVSRKKLAEMGLNPDQIMKLIEARAASGVDIIIKAIGQLLQMVERLMALSPQEQGQPAPREISATETNLIAGTTESVYGYLSDAFDEYRAAKKRILYESYMACGSQNLRVPVVNRYSRKIIEKAGFQVWEEDTEGVNSPNGIERHTIIGTKDKLFHDYIFTSRDGAERSANTQAANTLVQLLTVLQNPAVLPAVGKERFFGVINEIFRLSGAGMDLRLDLNEGEADSFGPDMNQQIQEVLQQLTAVSEQNTSDIQAIKEFLERTQAPPAAA